MGNKKAAALNKRRKLGQFRRWKNPKSVRRNEADDVEANEESPSSSSYPASNSTCPSREIAFNDGFISGNFNDMKTTLLYCNNEYNQDCDIYLGTDDKIENLNEEIDPLCERVTVEADSFNGGCLWEKAEMGYQKKENKEKTDQLCEAIAAETDSFSEVKQAGFLRMRVDIVDHKKPGQEEMNSRCAAITAETDLFSEDHQRGLLSIREERIDHKNGSQEETVPLREAEAAETDSFFEGHQRGLLIVREEMLDHKNGSQEKTVPLCEADAAETDSFSVCNKRSFLRVRAKRVDCKNRLQKGIYQFCAPVASFRAERADHKNRTQEEMDSLDKTINAETDSLAKDQQLSFSFNEVTDISGNDLEYKQSGDANQPRTVFACRLYGTCRKVRTLPVTERSIYTCRICGMSFFGRSNLITHLRIHYDDESFEYNSCKKRYTEQLRRDVHAQLCIGNTFQCEICGKTFTDRSSLSYHLKTHTDQRTFKCEVCPKLFRCFKTRKEHSKIHMKDRVKSFGCQLCNKRYYSSTGLRHHMVVHTGDKKHQCLICNKRFGLRSQLTRHMVVHTCEQPFKCEVCTAPFSRKDNYVTHMRLHSGTKPFECQVCHKTFAQSAGLSMHKKMHRDKTYKGK
ncbi:zinc finger protein 2-like [Artemia franciscana]|uniref:C2H2-type domain-containing protein n=1 Tax=Artemia franciscana TaxID=6661 RepID=A0AA88HWA8_ARTSF|nr:hypothetical protein QYM36_004926 [Artemia franciscana]